MPVITKFKSEINLMCSRDYYSKIDVYIFEFLSFTVKFNSKLKTIYVQDLYSSLCGTDINEIKKIIAIL